MKLALAWLLAMAFPAFGQGTILFDTRNVPKAAGGGATYNIPVFRWTGQGLGGGYVAGLYLPGAAEPFAKTLFRTDANTFFLLDPHVAVVPGGAPGQRVTIEFRCVDPKGAVYISRSFLTQPLGGPNPAGGTFPTPGLTGLGTEVGSGLTPGGIPTSCAGLQVFATRLGGTLQLSWPACSAKKYRLQSRTWETDWVNVGAEITGDQLFSGINLALPGGTAESYFRVMQVL